jgi:hypothetical protein
MTDEVPQSGEVSQLVERLFRHESGKMVGVPQNVGVDHARVAKTKGPNLPG